MIDTPDSQICEDLCESLDECLGYSFNESLPRCAVWVDLDLIDMISIAEWDSFPSSGEWETGVDELQRSDNNVVRFFFLS